MALGVATPNLLGISQAARRLDLSVARVRQLAVAGQLICIDTPYGRLFWERDVEAFDNVRKQGGHQVAEVSRA